MHLTPSQLAYTPSLDSDLRGHYTPHAAVRPPHTTASTLIETRLFRFRFPILVVVTYSGPYTLHVYDVEQGVELRTVRMTDVAALGERVPPYPALMDIEVGEGYVVWCYDSVVVIVDINALRDGELRVGVITESEEPAVLRDVAMQLHLQAKVPEMEKREWERKWRVGKTTQCMEVPGEVAMERYTIVQPKTEAIDAANGAVVVHGAASARPSAGFVSGTSSLHSSHLICVTDLAV